MDLRRARLLDRWAGSVLCAALSVLDSIRGRFVRQAAPEGAPRRVLFIELSEIGAAILAQPAVRRARELWPEAEIHFWIFAENADALGVQGLVPPERVHVIRSRGVRTVVWDALRGALALRRLGVDAVLDLELFSRVSALLGRLSGAARRAGFDSFAMEGLYRGSLHTRRVLYNPYRHVSSNFVALVESLAGEDQVPGHKAPSCEPPAAVPRAPGLESLRAAMERRIAAAEPAFARRRALFTLHVDLDSRLPLRDWPLERVRELAERLLRLDGVWVALAGKNRGQDVPRIEHERCLDLVGRTTMPELLGLLDLSAALVSHDSGMVHLAALTGAAVLAIFGPETPSLYGPLARDKTVFYKGYSCSPCLSAFNHRVSPCANNLCVQAVTVDEVYEAAVRRLGGSSGSSIAA